MAIHLELDSTYEILRAQVKGRRDIDEYREPMVQIASGELYPATIPTTSGGPVGEAEC